MGAVNCVQVFLNPFCREVHEGCLPDTKTIEIEPYTICSSHQLGLEVERPEQSTAFSIFRSFTFPFFAILHDKRNIIIF